MLTHSVYLLLNTRLTLR
ncbi:Protein of unknown function [Bacillus cereus]|nr:Protein of unknown function [Bacillus wiedmannii]SCV18424.1 Protein of unknown function [Bacillus cereus]